MGLEELMEKVAGGGMVRKLLRIHTHTHTHTHTHACAHTQI